jgi:hypothetical protein
MHASIGAFKYVRETTSDLTENPRLNRSTHGGNQPWQKFAEAAPSKK